MRVERDEGSACGRAFGILGGDGIWGMCWVWIQRALVKLCGDTRRGERTSGAKALTLCAAFEARLEVVPFPVTF